MSGAPPPVEPGEWLDRYGDDLYRYALSLLGKSSDAEDAVQETFAAALRGQAGFSGKSSEKTWLFGILKHKVADHFRRESRYLFVGEIEGKDGESSPYLPDGTWGEPPAEWSDPERRLQSKEFWKIFRECLGGLSPGVSRVFLLKFLDGRSTQEICKELGLSPTNVGVRMHRARLGLRKCLASRWFGRNP